MPKTEYKHIYFEDVSDMFPQRKTQSWDCYNRNGILLGVIRWFGKWRQYCFFIEIELVFSIGCMNDIIDFINQLNEERKNAKNKER